MKKLYLLLLVLISITFISSCEKDVPSIEKDEKETEQFNFNSCFVQKGPFIQGSSINIQELNDNFNPTGRNFNTSTKDDFGSFDLSIELEYQYVELIANGYYFNEVTGVIDGPIILRNTTKLSGKNSININVLTTLSKDRIEHLILEESFSFEDARSQAEFEVLKAFNYPDKLISEMSNFENLDISKTGKQNAILLAISSVIQKDKSSGEVSEFVSKINSDIKDNGVLDNLGLLEDISTSYMMINSDTIKSNLEKRYSSLNLANEIPNIEPFLDKDGDGILNEFDFETKSPMATIPSTKPIFRWEKPNSNLEDFEYQYTFQLSDNKLFNHILLSVENIKDDSIISSINLENSKIYYWRIAFFNNGEIISNWEDRQFKIELAQVKDLYPTGEISQSKNSFGWLKVDSEYQNYHLQIATDIELSNLIVDLDNINSNEIIPEFVFSNNSSYYWRVAYVDENGISGEWSNSEFRILLSKLQISYPIESISDTKPSFSWIKSEFENIKYDFELSEDINFENITLSNYEFSYNTHTINIALKTNKDYFWRVRYKDNNNIESDWTQSSFNIGLPNINTISPRDSYTDTKPKFLWDISQVENIKYYFELSAQIDFSNIILEANDIETTYLDSEIVLENNKDYYWRVKYMDTNGVFSNWTTTSFNIELPSINNIYPESYSEIIDSKPTISWTQPDIGVKSYSIEIIKNNETYEEPIYISQLDLTTNSYQPTKTLQPGHYRYRIGYTDLNNTFSGWYDIGDFGINFNLVELNSPEGNIEELRPKFKWEPSSIENVTYEIEVSDDSNYNNIIMSQAEINSDSYSFDISFENNKEYYWRGRYTDTNGAVSDWSTSTFNTDIYVEQTEIISPSDLYRIMKGDIIKWRNITSEEVSYHLKINDSHGNIIIEEKNLLTNAYEINYSKLEINQRYIINIASVNQNGVHSDWHYRIVTYAGIMITTPQKPGEIINSDPVIIEWKSSYDEGEVYNVVVSRIDFMVMEDPSNPFEEIVTEYETEWFRYEVTENKLELPNYIEEGFEYRIYIRSSGYNQSGTEADANFFYKSMPPHY